MASARRAARAGLNRPQGEAEGPPEWLWQFSYARWFRERSEAGEVATIEEAVKARRRWREARDAWLQRRGLVMPDMRGLSWHEFKQIEREEPHRILRRPDD